MKSPIYDGTWWAVKLWWKTSDGSLYESGGHFAGTSDDTPIKVIERVAMLRMVPLDVCHLVECEKHEADS